MKTMVFNVAADKGGALTILNQYYNMAKVDVNDDWIFVVGLPMLEDTENIKVLRYPWIKKSWIHRLYFELFVARRIIERYSPDEILSLQNIMIKGTKVKQTVYVHQSLPFSEKKFGIIENPKFWIYQNIIGNLIKRSIKKADRVVVQTEWMKIACMKATRTTESKFIVCFPKTDIRLKSRYVRNEGEITFFYPAGPYQYKNHTVIVRASEVLKLKGINGYKIIFTLSGNENKYVRKLHDLVLEQNLPILFEGEMNLDKVYDYYGNTTLIFSSYIETIGLPLLEAKLHEAPIIVGDFEFSREVLNDYSKAVFFDAFNPVELSTVLEKEINGTLY